MTSLRQRATGRIGGTPDRSSLPCLTVFVWLVAWSVQTPVVSYGADPIKIGISAALSGPAKHLGQEMRLGIDTYLRRINRSGGVHGQPVHLVALDDGYIPELAAANMHRLIDEENVLAIVGNIGTPTALLTVPIANQKQVLIFGALTGAGLLRNSPPDRYVINYRASYAEETASMISGLLAIGIRPYEIALFTQDDAYGDAGYDGAITALKSAGFVDTGTLPHGRYRRNTLDVEEGLLKILFADVKPRAVILVGTNAACAKFIRLAKTALPSALFLNVSFVGSEALLWELGEAAEGVIVTQVVPHYRANLQIVDEYLQDLRSYDLDAQPGFVSLEGYIVAKIFVEALRRAEDPLTRESIIDAVENIEDLDIGLGSTISYSSRNHQASRTVWPTMIQDGQFVEINWSDLKADDQ